jgi:hypothetical protein
MRAIDRMLCLGSDDLIIAEETAGAKHAPYC